VTNITQNFAQYQSLVYVCIINITLKYVLRMENAEKIEKMTFKDYYQSLDEEMKKEVRNNFLEGSGISYPTFYSKLTRENYSLLERKLLETICQTTFIW